MKEKTTETKEITSVAVGSVGDIFKHVLLVALLKNQVEEKRKTHSRDFTFGYLDTHCGNYTNPISKVKEGSALSRFLEEIEDAYVPSDKHELNTLLNVVFASVKEGQYPSSWGIVNKVLSLLDVSDPSLKLYDTSAQVAKNNAQKIHPDSPITFESKDAFKHYKDNSLYRTDFIFIDPAYKADGTKPSKDWVEVGKMMKYLKSKGIPFMVKCPLDVKETFKKLPLDGNVHTVILHENKHNSLGEGHVAIIGNIDGAAVDSVVEDIAELDFHVEYVLTSQVNCS